jgi:hypothetical protein
MAILDPVTRVPWLMRGFGGKFLYALVLQLRALIDMATAAIKIRFPGLYSNETLPIIGRERKIRRGRVETDETYARRLLRWWDDHKRRGGPYALLEQLHAYYAPNNFPIELVYASGRRFSLAVDGTITKDDISWPNPPAAKWARWWLIFHWPEVLEGPGKWGESGDKWGAGGVWGSGLSRAEVDSIRLIPAEWNAAHTLGMILIMGPGVRKWGYPPRKWGTGGGKWGNGSGKTVQIAIS